MAKFFIKIFIFLLPVLIFMAIPRFTKFIMDADLEAKINTFLPEGNDVEIVIAGDSRAERQLIPNIFENETKKKTVNIAKDIADVKSLLYSNNKYNFTDSNKIFVIGVSSLLINDGSYRNWFMSQASMTEIGLLKRILLFKGDYPENWYHRMGLIWDDLISEKRGKELYSNDIRLNNKGYYPIDKYIEIDKMYEIDLCPKTTEHLWYREPNNNGIRRKVFEKSIEQLSKTEANIVLIQSPMAPTWRDIVDERFMHQMERDFSILLNEIENQYDNVWIIDFYLEQSELFTDELFYNATHLNKKGAEVFTMAVIDSIKSLGLLN